jgi:hypothetical protein
MPAREIEAAVSGRVAEALEDPLSLAAQAWLVIAPGEVSQVIARSAAAATAVATQEPGMVRLLVQKVRLLSGRMEIDIASRALGDLLHVPVSAGAPAAVTLACEVRLTRTGRALRLIQNSGRSVRYASPDPTLLKLVAKARSWWGELRTGGTDIPTLARREGVTHSYVTRIVRLAFLSPAVIDSVLAGTQLANVSCGALAAPGAIPIDWAEQLTLFKLRTPRSAWS